MRVGRAPLDEDAIRLIEESNPGVEFDWTRILKGQDGPAEPRPPVQHERRARPRPPGVWPASAAQGTGQRSSLPRSVPTPAPVEPAERPTDPPTDPAALTAAHAQTEPIGLVDLESETQPRTSSSPPSAALTRLGSEGLARLRARHAEVLARISEKAADPAQREQLKAAADRLNPDTWVTEAEVAAGLESYEAVFESVRGVIGQRRNRRRGRPGDVEPPTAAAAPAGLADGDAPLATPPDDGRSTGGTAVDEESGRREIPAADE